MLHRFRLIQNWCRFDDKVEIVYQFQFFWELILLVDAGESASDVETGGVYDTGGPGETEAAAVLVACESVFLRSHKTLIHHK